MSLHRLLSCFLALMATGAFFTAIAAEQYPLGPDSQRKEGVPRGKVTQGKWTSKIYPGTVRDYWLYVPQQYDPAKPAPLMVFQDGKGFAGEEGRWRVPIVFDNLIASGEMPPTVALMVDPGVLAAASETQQGRFNRSFEYDALGNRYARFLIEELIPEIGKTVKISPDPNDRAIAGSSSGAIAAFTVAWNRPDAFRRVLSFIGSYTNLRGGHNYASLVRKSEPKPLRVFLQDGRNDLNIYSGSWFQGNQDLSAALEYAGYDTRFIIGEEAHNSIHGSSILPDALRWLWRDYGKPIETKSAVSDRHWVRTITVPGEGWQQVSQGHRFTEGPAVDAAGNVFFTDIPNNRIHKIAPDGKVSVFKEDSGGANGLMFGADGKMYACQNGRKRIVAFAPDGTEEILAEDVNSNDLAVTSEGRIYFTEPPTKKVWLLEKDKTKRAVIENQLDFPNGVRLSPDQSLLLVADARNKWVWSYSLAPDGTPINGQPFYRMETPDDSSSSSADGMTLDTEGHLYVATRMGVQICDQPGRVVGILDKPQDAPLSNVVFAGEGMSTLYATAGDKVYKRKLARRGFLPWQPVKPPTPRL